MGEIRHHSKDSENYKRQQRKSIDSNGFSEFQDKIYIEQKFFKHRSKILKHLVQNCGSFIQIFKRFVDRLIIGHQDLLDSFNIEFLFTTASMSNTTLLICEILYIFQPTIGRLPTSWKIVLHLHICSFIATMIIQFQLQRVQRC